MELSLRTWPNQSNHRNRFLLDSDWKQQLCWTLPEVVLSVGQRKLASCGDPQSKSRSSWRAVKSWKVGQKCCVGCYQGNKCMVKKSQLSLSICLSIYLARLLFYSHYLSWSNLQSLVAKNRKYALRSAIVTGIMWFGFFANTSDSEVNQCRRGLIERSFVALLVFSFACFAHTLPKRTQQADNDWRPAKLHKADELATSNSIR